MRQNIIQALTLITFLSIASEAFADSCHSHLDFAVVDKQDQVDQILCNDAYAVGYSYFYKVPLWASYKLTRDSVTPNNGRGGNPFEEDTRIPKEHRSTLWDYKYSGYDRGHMGPRAALDFTPDARNQTFLLSNMTPQHAELNQEGWRELEVYVVDLAKKHEEVYVVTGALFDGDNKTIGKSVYVPSHLFKAIYVPSLKDALGFIIENKPFDIDDLQSKQVSINAIENRSGLQLFNEIPDNFENQMEKESIDYCHIFGKLSLSEHACGS